MREPPTENTAVEEAEKKAERRMRAADTGDHDRHGRLPVLGGCSELLLAGSASMDGVLLAKGFFLRELGGCPSRTT